MNRPAGGPDPAATNLVNLANVASLEGDYGEAAQRYREALAIYSEHGNRLDGASVLHNLGLLAMRRGDYAAAVRVLAEARGIYCRYRPFAEANATRDDPDMAL